ncbi:NAD-dependent epimerase/dehydratase family protein [Egibacter rhizosphaerae]|uniref:NAD-dependent epimerase/dehydratase family protein n=1 Tax=Egibacter rhizosphaerae TaxID=1670831 RepID=A0A411YGF4_9ACTN|nr:NAD-dependent epimerase/dehydratase family protein [Egibacter rhizosphaerae]QBI20320.1 NAD-dependent epimerase/dehydratase family protein [Egibacter rhizosphaerae]
MADEHGRRILVTGISGALAGALVQRLEADDRVDYVGGVDLDDPCVPLERAEFIRADLRNPLVARVIESTGVDTLVHLALVTTPAQGGGRARMKELNVIGTMQLLAAAQKAPRLERVVVRSSTALYGSHYRDPALFGEDSTIDVSSRAGYAKDAGEVEGYARGLARRRPDLTLTLLRLANTVGPTVETPLTRYFQLPVAPTVLGYDPRLQLLHEDDAVEVLQRATMEGHPGLYNVAGPGIVYLSQAIRLAGKVEAPLPRPLLPLVAGWLRSAGLVDFSPDQLQFLLFGRVADTTRLQRTFGFMPEHDTRTALTDFLAERAVEPLIEPERVEELEARLLGLARRTLRTGGQPAPGDREDRAASRATARPPAPQEPVATPGGHDGIDGRPGDREGDRP